MENYFMRVFVMVVVVVIVCVMESGAQTLLNEKKAVIVGKPMPEFVIRPDGKQQKAITNKTLLGKPAIITFFSTGCIAAFHTIPKIDKMYRKFRDDVTFVTAANDKDSIRKVWKQFRPLYNIELPVVFDSGAFESLGLRAVPTLIWLTREGIVDAVTYQIDEREIKKLIGGEALNLPDSSPEGKRKSAALFDREKPLLMEGNGEGMEVLQHSVLTRWKPGIARQSLGPSWKGEHPMLGLERLQLTDCGLTELYRIAYAGRSFAYRPPDTVRYGKWQYLPILEVADPSPFTDTNFGRNAYCYSQTLPPSKRTPEAMMEVMQQDLKLSFGYEVSIETHKMSYYRLVVIDSTKIRRSMVDRKQSNYHDVLGGRIARTTIANLISLIDHHSATSWNYNLPILDETGIDYEIDIRVEGITTSIEDTARGLRKSGLDLLLGERDFKVLVIRDPVTNKIK